MKKIYLLILLSFYFQNYSQENKDSSLKNLSTNNTFQEEELDKTLHFDLIWRIYAIKPMQFGNNALADAHNNGGGFGTSLILLNYMNFRLGYGYEFTKYQVSDVSKVGNFKNTNTNTSTLYLSYDYKINKKYQLTPSFGYGISKANQKSGSQRFGGYSGNHLQIGVFNDYEIGKNLALSLGIHYINTRYKIKTNQEYLDYFNNSNQIQFSLGLKIF